MFRRLSISTLTLNAFCSTALASVPPDVHKKCLEAKDYAGCVNAQTGKTSTAVPQRIVSDQGIATSGGNKCPAGYAYVGQGYCQEVKCEYNSAGFNELGHDQTVAGKSNWKCKYSFWHGAGVLRLGSTVRVGNDEKCPSGEPLIGWNSTCEDTTKAAAPKSDTKTESTNNRPGPAWFSDRY